MKKQAWTVWTGSQLKSWGLWMALWTLWLAPSARACPEVTGVFQLEELACESAVDSSVVHLTIVARGRYPYWLIFSGSEIRAVLTDPRHEVPVRAVIRQQIDRCDDRTEGTLYVDRLEVDARAIRQRIRHRLEWAQPDGRPGPGVKGMPRRLDLKGLAESFKTSQGMHLLPNGNLYLMTDWQLAEGNAKGDGGPRPCLLKFSRLR